MALANSSVMPAMQPLSNQRRILRRPSHTFHLIHKPWVIQPFCIAPVLPGETMRNALLQSRAVTDPLENPLIGWWLENYLFYVRHRDIDTTDKDLQAMVLDPATPVSDANLIIDQNRYWAYEAYDAGDSTDYPRWVSLCEKAVVEAYFRDEGESWTDHTIDGVPSCQTGQRTWMDSVINDTDYLTPDFNVDLDADTNVEASEVARALAMWQVLSQRGLVQMSYEEWLQTYGVKGPEAVVAGVPELLRYWREWVYPSNTIEPASGAPSSACSWSLRLSADKDRYFPEPGFIFGVTVARPKVYYGLQNSHAAQLMNDAYSWLPASALNDPALRRRQVTAGDGPLFSHSDDWWFDPGDLLRYGDQFFNYVRTTDEVGIVELPTAGGDLKYPTEAMADPLFVDNTTPLEYVRQDGVIKFAISTHVRDVTPTALTP